MTGIDFGRSFVTFVTPERFNNARIQVEARIEFGDAEAGTRTASTDACPTREELYLLASCKSEHTYAERDLFQQPNYDFCGVFNETQFSIIRTRFGDTRFVADCGPVRPRFERVHAQIVSRPAERLDSVSDIVQATLAGELLIARTEIASPDGRRTCLLEYPVKTMNANDIVPMYQVDTGPVAYPDWDSQEAALAGRFRLAYVAFNAPDFADFVILAPTELAPGAVTPHYSEVASVAARNEVWRVG
jgi:hypothetical protein